MAGIFLLPLALAEQRSVTWYSEPIHLRPSEVHNRVGTPIRLPPSLSRDFANSSIAVRSFTVDVVTVDGGNGEERSVPLHEAYNHHYIVFAGSKHGIEQLYNHTAADGFDPLGGTCEKPPSNELLSMRTHKAHRAGFTQFGGASGAEFRNNPHDYPEPYTYIIPTPEHALVLLHLINQQPLADGAAHADAEASRGPPYFECPCTPQRDFDLAAGTIDGCYPRPPFECTDALRAQRNSGCSLEQYYGGYRCCEHGVFLADTAKHDVRRGPVSTYMLKFTLNYRAHLPAHDRPLHPTACCDVTEGMRTPSSRRFGGNVEYDIPQCAKGTPTEQCVHVATSVHPVDWTGPEDKHDPNEIIEVRARAPAPRSARPAPCLIRPAPTRLCPPVILGQMRARSSSMLWDTFTWARFTLISSTSSLASSSAARCRRTAHPKRRATRRAISLASSHACGARRRCRHRLDSSARIQCARLHTTTRRSRTRA